MSSMLVHDMRLAGATPSGVADNNYEVDGTVSIQHMFDWIHSYSQQQGGLLNLYIMCHGFEADWNLTDQTCTGFQVGGFGLALCAEGLTSSNVDVAKTINGDAKSIIIFACATADTGAGNDGTSADGMKFCGQLAMNTGATVIAATQTQWYVKDQTLWQWITSQQGQINFGNWEGPVYSFSPTDGSSSQICASPQPTTN